MPFTIFNSLTRTKERFTPLIPGHVGIYVCGPTVYSHSHVGHGKSYVSFDVLVRFLRFSGMKVVYVQNITDVGHLLDDGEDRMLKQSRLEKIHPMMIAETITRSYYDDMDALGVQRPDIAPRASGHITEQIELVRSLLEKGFAYEVDGSVYFDVRKVPSYGKLSGRTVEEAVGGTRVSARSEKRNPEDFALWKRAEPEHIMRWPSPWGVGFPGWHVECSAMSMKYLGETFDIHGGGLDNQFPHHECEIAQSEGVTGHPFARYWVHNNLVTVDGKKMSKSLGNFVTLKDLFKSFHPLVVRFFILQSHYRSTLDFSEQAMQAARTGHDRLLNTVKTLRQATPGPAADVPAFDATPYRTRIVEALEDDLNTPQAIAVLFDLAKDLNSRLAAGGMTEEGLQAADAIFRDLGAGVLGIIPDHMSADASTDAVDEGRIMELLIALRNEARASKNFPLSDRIRDGLKAIGIVLEDRKDGTGWKRG